MRNPHAHFLTVPFSKTLSIHLLEIVNADNAREDTFMNKFISTIHQHLGILIYTFSMYTTARNKLLQWRKIEIRTKSSE